MASPPPLSGKSAVYAVLGDPIEHSLSPVFQNEALQAAGLDAVYIPLRVAAAHLEGFLKGIAHTSLQGFNATVPLKEALVPLCNKLSPEAALIGAVNTVEIKAGKLIGHNTDGHGFLASLTEEAKFDPRKKKVCIIGAGGASRAIACALGKAGAGPIVFCNRTLPRVQRLANELSKKLPKAQIQACSLRKTELARAVEGADLVVQTTPVGLDGRGLIVLPWGVLPKKALVADIVYMPRLTPFLAEAKRRRYRILEGLGMLVHQGALSFEIWTGKKPDVARMRRAAERALR